MENGKLQKTEGLPFKFGIAAGIFALLSVVLSANLTQVYMTNLVAQYGLPASYESFGYIGSVGGFIINPGIFLILLIRARKKPARGTAFGVVWLIVAALSILSDVSAMVSSNPQTAEMQQLAETLVPGGMFIAYALSIVGSLCMAVTCILILMRIRQATRPPMGPPTAQEPVLTEASDAAEEAVKKPKFPQIKRPSAPPEDK